MTARVISESPTPGAFTVEDNPEYDDELRLALRIGHHNFSGLKLAATNAMAAAVAEFDAAVKVCPTFAEAWFLRGHALKQMRRNDLAYDSFAEACMTAPMFIEAERELAALAAVLGRAPAILTPWYGIRRPNPLRRIIHKIVNAFSRPTINDAPVEESEAELRRAFAAAPKSAVLADKLAWRLQRQRRVKEAEVFFRYALWLEPWHGRAAAGLGILLANAHRYQDAYDVSVAAMAAGAADDRLSGIAYWAALNVADWTHLEAWQRRAIAALKRDPRSAAFPALYLADDPQLHQRSVSVLARAHDKDRDQTPFVFRETALRPIVLGYISADFRDHPVARLTAELFGLHDRKRFRVLGYGLMNDEGSEIGARIRRSFDQFTDVSAISPRACAARIQADRVDILIDLSGNTAHGPNSIIARRSAPVQVNYLGYPGTSGSRHMDYIIADRTIIPPDNQKWFTEAVVYMPECHQVNDRKRVIGGLRARKDYGLPAEGVVYCSFNETKKVTPELFDLWMRILTRVAGSVLWLSIKNENIAANLRARASDADVDPARLVYASRLPNHEDHMARYLVSDFFLDTIVYNGHTTTSDALWVGCPGVALLGQSYPTRVAASLLQAVGLSDLVVCTLQEYEDLAVRAGLDAGWRQELRTRAQSARQTSPLFDTPRFVNCLEWAYERMWDIYVEGRAPGTFNVPAMPRV